MTRAVLGALALAIVFVPTLYAQIASPKPFGKTPDGTAVEEYTLKNAKGMIVKLSTLGATITEIDVPDKNGKLDNVNLGFDKAEDYLGPDNQYFGCTTGRVCNRIENGKFKIDGKEYQVALKPGEKHQLHGGVKRSLDRVVWTAKPAKDGQKIEFTYSSPDGEEGFPGKLDLTVTYELTDNNDLVIKYVAVTDKATPVNLTNHAYFNLAGAGAKTVLDHELMIPSDKMCEMTKDLLPSGKMLPVAGTIYDFRKTKSLGKDIPPIKEPGPEGYDLAYELPKSDTGLVKAAVLTHPESGRTLTVSTDQPAVQLYTGNFLRGQKGRDGKTYANRSAVCLETFAFANSMNIPTFPNVILRPGETYRHTCVYGFSVK